MRQFAAVSILAATVCALALTACGSGSSGTASGQLSLAMVTDVGGLGDNSFNDSAYKGLVRARDQLGANIQVVQSKSTGDYVKNLADLADQHAAMIYGIGSLMAHDLQEAAHTHPRQRYAIVDAVVPEPNVVSITFKEQDGSFLAGALAAMVSLHHHVAFLGGEEIPVMQHFEAGFIAGVHEVDPAAKVDVAYAGSFDDSARGEREANRLFDGGADIIYTAAGKAGQGAIAAVKQRPRGYYLIGVDNDQDGLAPGKILTSMVKHVDVAVFRVAQALKNGEPMHGSIVLGLKDQAISLTDFRYTNDIVGPEKVMRLNRLQTGIVNGRIVVPQSRAELARWKPSTF